MKQLETVAGILDQHGSRRCIARGRCWRRDLNAAGNIRTLASGTVISLLKPLVYQRRLPTAASGGGKEGDGPAAPP